MWNIRCSIIVFVLMLTHTREIIVLYAFVNNGVNELIVFRYIYLKHALQHDRYKSFFHTIIFV